MKFTFVLTALSSALLCFSCTEKKEEPSFLPDYRGVWTTPPGHTPTILSPDGAICGNGDIGMVLGGTPDRQTFYLSKADFWKAQNGYPNGGVAHIGRLQLTIPGMENAPYHVEQQISDATLNGRFCLPDSSGYRLQAWCAATRNIAVIRVTAENAPLRFRLGWAALHESQDITTTEGTTDGFDWYVRKFDDPTLEWPSAVCVSRQVVPAPTDSLIALSPGETASIVLAFCTNHDRDDYRQHALQLLKENGPDRLQALFDAHRQWWASFWNQSQVCLGDTTLEKYYYGSHYLLACSSRNPAFPPGLWGTCLTTDHPAWAGDYHLNYNHQAPWWGVYSSNHVELSDPYDTPILEYMEKGREHARAFLGKKGVYYPVGIGPKGWCSSMYPLTAADMKKVYGITETGLEGGYMFLGQKSDAVFATANMFMRFYHTYDRTYAEKVYPFIREVADFWEDYLVFENGRYVSYNDCFWEVGPWEGKDYKKNFGDINPTVSLGLCRMLFRGIIEMSQFLQKDTDKIEKWQHILAHLSDIPTVEVEGVTRIKACEGGNGSGSRTAPGFGRVMMHGLVFPSGAFGPVNDPAFAKILLDEVYRWKTDTIPTTAEWKDAGWTNLSNGFETYFTSAARLGYDGESLLSELLTRIQKTALPNLWVTQSGGGIETMSAIPSCINEMLLQSYEGVIRIFPVWPKHRPASFRHLRTHGAFLVSASCKQGETESVTLFSEQGRTCILENPWKGSACEVVRSDGSRQVIEGDRIELPTSKGETLRLQKQAR